MSEFQFFGKLFNFANVARLCVVFVCLFSWAAKRCFDDFWLPGAHLRKIRVLHSFTQIKFQKGVPKPNFAKPLSDVFQQINGGLPLYIFPKNHFLPEKSHNLIITGSCNFGAF